MSEKLNELKARIGEVSDLGSVAGLLGWDQQVNMPAGGAEARGRHMATLGKIMQEKFTSDEVGRLLEAPVEPRLPELAEQPPGVVVLVTG